MKQKKPEDSPIEEEKSKYYHEVIPTNLGYMTQKEFNELCTPERRVFPDQETIDTRKSRRKLFDFFEKFLTTKEITERGKNQKKDREIER